jgi:UDP-N-acetylglucosamine acyltransferase
MGYMKENVFDPRALIIGEVVIGTGNYFGPGCVIYGPIVIGDNNFFGANCVIGAPPQDDAISLNAHVRMSRGEAISDGSISIGNGNIIREFVTIHRGEISETEIHNNIYLMAYSHIAHDCRIQSNVKITNAVQLGGYTTICYGVNIGLSAVIHQWSVVGAYAMIGMNSTVAKSIPPGSLAVGSPARIKGPNIFSLEKIGIADTNFWSEYLADLDCPEVPIQLIPFIESYKKELTERMVQQSFVKNWRIEALKNIHQ